MRGRGVDQANIEAGRIYHWTEKTWAGKQLMDSQTHGVWGMEDRTAGRREVNIQGKSTQQMDNRTDRVCRTEDRNTGRVKCGRGRIGKEKRVGWRVDEEGEEGG